MLTAVVSDGGSPEVAIYMDTRWLDDSHRGPPAASLTVVPVTPPYNSTPQPRPLLANINLQLLVRFCLLKLSLCPAGIENKHDYVLRHCVNMPGNWLHAWKVRLPVHLATGRVAISWLCVEGKCGFDGFIRFVVDRL